MFLRCRAWRATKKAGSKKNFSGTWKKEVGTLFSQRADYHISKKIRTVLDASSELIGQRKAQIIETGSQDSRFVTDTKQEGRTIIYAKGKRHILSRKSEAQISHRAQINAVIFIPLRPSDLAADSTP